jgi:hypothetical protein
MITVERPQLSLKITLTISQSSNETWAIALGRGMTKVINGDSAGTPPLNHVFLTYKWIGFLWSTLMGENTKAL